MGLPQEIAAWVVMMNRYGFFEVCAVSKTENTNTTRFAPVTFRYSRDEEIIVELHKFRDRDDIDVWIPNPNEVFRFRVGNPCVTKRDADGNLVLQFTAYATKVEALSDAKKMSAERQEALSIAA